MKKLTPLICFICFIVSFNALFAQETADALGVEPLNYKKRSPVYDYSEHQLNNTDTIPDFDIKPNKLMITGTIYQNDGVTPASDVVLFIYQPDDYGNFEMKRDSSRKRYVHHRAWIKTDSDGKYTFYTFMPGKYLRSKELKQIHRVIKEPGKPEYDINPFFFNDDPLIPDLTLACRSRMVNSMLRLEQKDGMYMATKDIRLPDTNDLIK
jgi:protocatechuate 3,4-dioxygenase beta subunit